MRSAHTLGGGIWVLGLGVTAVLGGCLAVIEDSPEERAAPGDGGPTPSGAAVCDKPGVGLSSMRRLSRLEYERTVEVALGVAADALPATMPDEFVHGTDFVANLSPVSVDHARAFLAAARAVADAVDLTKQLPCAVSAGERACATTFVEAVSPLLHRRPTDATSRAAYLAVFDAVIGEGGFELAVRAVLEAMLQSPFLLYHVELGEAGGGTGHLTGPELANRLSFMLWRAPPDDVLRAAAESGALLLDGELEAQVRRLLADDRAIAGVQAFLSAWLGIPDVPDADLDDHGRSARQELGRFTEHLLRDDVPWSRVYEADYTWVDATLAELYGVEPPSVGFERRELDVTQRRGLLTSAAFLSASFHPNVLGDRYVIMQGKTIRERILCEGLPPPIELPSDAPRPEDYGTAREFSDALIDHATCGGCHGLMDPIGRGFAHYDARGRFMMENADGPVDAIGEIRGTTEPVLAGAFQGVPELASRLSQSDGAESCFVRQFSRYALSRLDEQADGCSVVLATVRMKEGVGTLTDLIVGVVLSESFRSVAGKPEVSTEPEVCGG